MSAKQTLDVVEVITADMKWGQKRRRSGRWDSNPRPSPWQMDAPVV